MTDTERAWAAHLTETLARLFDDCGLHADAKRLRVMFAAIEREAAAREVDCGR